ncbi:hypothetical protein FKW77_002811 [Venturia effusa]|uniref:Uncharacterized protein n=1 Tax=Venturia effusa TaxID=50376 RepID=A0A517L501_9PEZI|nr:hypothetical protein FKW77_002811 [Venturia effusa]
MYGIHYKRDPETPSPVTDLDFAISSYSHTRATDLSPISDLSCIQLCKDAYSRRNPDDGDWTGDNCHNYCNYKMQVCTDIGHIDLPLSAINIASTYGNGLTSPNGHVILFDEPDYTSDSRILWASVIDLDYIDFKDRAKPLLVMPR